MEWATIPRYKYSRDEILRIPEVEGMIKRAPYLWLKSLIAFLYLYGPRISEAIGVQGRHIYVDPPSQPKYLAAQIGILKTRTAAKGGPFKIRPHILKVPLEHPFTDTIRKHRDRLTAIQYLYMISPTKQSSRTLATAKMKQLNRNCSPHLFRHSRLMKLALKGATAFQLRDWAGWTDIRPAMSYVRAAGTLAAQLSDKVID